MINNLYGNALMFFMIMLTLLLIPRYDLFNVRAVPKYLKLLNEALDEAKMFEITLNPLYFFPGNQNF